MVVTLYDIYTCPKGFVQDCVASSRSICYCLDSFHQKPPNQKQNMIVDHIF